MSFECKNVSNILKKFSKLIFLIHDTIICLKILGWKPSYQSDQISKAQQQH